MWERKKYQKIKADIKPLLSFPVLVDCSECDKCSASLQEDMDITILVPNKIHTLYKSAILTDCLCRGLQSYYKAW